MFNSDLHIVINADFCLILCKYILCVGCGVSIAKYFYHFFFKQMTTFIFMSESQKRANHSTITGNYAIVVSFSAVERNQPVCIKYMLTVIFSFIIPIDLCFLDAVKNIF